MLFILLLQAELGISKDGAKELRETLKIAETKLMESSKIIEELKLQSKAKIEELELKVNISSG